MSSTYDYLGPYKKTGPSSYELGPISITAKALSGFSGGGGYSNWGLNDGPRRGTSEGSGKLSPLTPYIWDDLMHEHQLNQSSIDDEYAGIFNKVTETTNREIEKAKQDAKEGHQLSPVAMVKKDQEITFKLIQAKEAEYRSKIESAHSLYGQNPFFLMKELPFKKVMDGMNQTPPDILGAYNAIDLAYRSALELKRLSLTNDVLAKQLEDLAKKSSLAELGSQPDQGSLTSFLADRLSTVNLEKDIHLQRLPFFLQEKIVTATGSAEGFTHVQSLVSYKATIDNMITDEQSAIGSYAAANPNISSPLSKPELEALKNLVGLQANTNLGKRWQDYHVSLLHSETVRHLTETTSAFGKLITRAQEAETLQAQARLAVETEAKRVADEQIRVAEAIRIANTFRAPGPASAVTPLFMTSVGTVAVIEAAAVTLQAAIGSAIATLTSLAAGTASGLLVGVSALVYSPKLANGELPESYAFSTPLSDLTPEHRQDLPAIAAAGGTVDLPVRVSSKTAADGRSEVFVAKTDGVTVPSKVRVVTATYNAEQNVYSVTTADVPPRTLTWTPIVNPGNSSTTSPAEQPVLPVYTEF
ncbi:S-type pyocin domain-containing protein [Pseudomonas sp.]|uniref:S-type pyocin domain-containing protein n=1 Tax=Pseudomonas sp. TaxID=306 RepID=UPI003F972858